jgi:hypothetical protein
MLADSLLLLDLLRPNCVYWNPVTGCLGVSSELTNDALTRHNSKRPCSRTRPDCVVSAVLRQHVLRAWTPERRVDGSIWKNTTCDGVGVAVAPRSV